MKMTNEIEMMLLSVDEMINALEKSEAEALKNDMLKDFEEILYKVYSTIMPNMFKSLSDEKLQKRISDCVNLEMQIARQKSTREIYRDIRMYQKACNL